MRLITIRQSGDLEQSPNALVSFDHQGGGFAVTVRGPFGQAEEERLAWYFEEHLRRPHLDQVRAREAAASIRAYGEALFKQIFEADPRLYARYVQARQEGLQRLCFEINGSPAFQQLHWEALADPDVALPLALEAAMIRTPAQSSGGEIRPQEAGLIRLLLVTARPQGRYDMGYRTIARPLVEGLQRASLPVRVELVRPGTYQALVDHLNTTRDRYGVGYYQIIHFDLHGAVLNYRELANLEGVSAQSCKVLLKERYARPQDIAPPQPGQPDPARAYLFFEGPEEGQLDPAEASELAGLLQSHHLPIAILNACQSGKQVGDSETSLGSRLVQAGVETVLAMGYSVTVNAAQLLMETLYGRLFERAELLPAIRQARAALHHHKQRRVYFNQTISLEDWLLPVVYRRSAEPARLPLKPAGFEEEVARLAQQARRYQVPEPAYGFVGRDLDILQIEKRLLRRSEGKRRNLLLLRGMGGAGKTTLLHHLAGWWQNTGLVQEVFYFGYDRQAYTLAQIVDTLAQRLYAAPAVGGLEGGLELMKFRAMPPQLQQEKLAQTLRTERHLLILDNLESITGQPLAIKNSLPAAEQAALRGFLGKLLDGQTLVLLGSRSGEGWLGASEGGPLRPVDVYDLAGLDPEAASRLAERILERHVPQAERRTSYRRSGAFGRLLKLLDGYPLALEVVLANLARQKPDDILAALQSGQVALDPQAGDPEARTRSLIRCIDYSHGHLSPEAQTLLLCLFPFTGVVNVMPNIFDGYINQLKQQPELASLPFEQFPDVLQAAQDWGLLTPHPEVSGYLQLQPILPYFLKARIAVSGEPLAVSQEQLAISNEQLAISNEQLAISNEQLAISNEQLAIISQSKIPNLKSKIETTFRRHYDDLGDALADMLQAKEPQQRQVGRRLVGLEYENLLAALDLALAVQASIANIYTALSNYLDTTQEHQRGLVLGQQVLSRLESYPAEALAGPLGAEFVQVLDDIASRQLETKQYAAAETSYQKVLSIWLTNQSFEPDVIKQKSSSIYHQLGYVAQEQRQWPQAEAYYRQALDLCIAFDDRYSQARTYHQLGYVAQEQRQWPQAEAYYRQALDIKIAFDDRYSQASTYHQLGMVAQEQRQWPQAEAYYRQALDIYLAFDDRYSQASTYHQLGYVAQEQRQWQQAEAYYRQALDIKIAFDDRYSQASTYHQLGMVAQEQRQWPQAEAYYRQALDIYLAFDDRYSQASTYHQLGRVAQEQEQWPQAEAYYRQALDIKIAFDDRYSQASAYHQLGRVAQEQEQWPQAEAYYRQALDIKIAFDDRYSQASTYGQLGRVAEEQEQWAQAYDYLVKALTIFVEFKDEYSVGITLRSLARVWQVRPDEAILAAVAGVLGVSVEEARRRIEERGRGQVSGVKGQGVGGRGQGSGVRGAGGRG
jgi:tetratricopeptide (TPR) repeat protein